MPPCQAGTYPYIIRSGDSLWIIAQHFNTNIQEIMSANPGLDINHLSIGQVICIPRHTQPTHISMAEQTLSNHMRLLWEQHIYWTRLVILSMAFDLPETELAINRLLQNPKDFEAVFKPLYGQDIAAKFAELFTTHLTIAAELIKAAKAGDSTAASDAEKRWYTNADQISSFLGSINPHWSAQEWQRMLYNHLEMTKNEAVDILTQKYADSIIIVENIEQEALKMADMMTQGIVRQFPHYFS